MSFLENPILRRELFSRLRSPKTFMAIVSVAVLTSLLVLLRWPTDATVDLVSQGALQVFRPVAFALAIALMMLIPAFPATALVSERRRGTLALMLNSPTTPWTMPGNRAIDFSSKIQYALYEVTSAPDVNWAKVGTSGEPGSKQ